MEPTETVLRFACPASALMRYRVLAPLHAIAHEG